MSFRLVDLCFDVPELSVSEFAVLAALCRSASNDDYTCFPSLETVALAAHIGLRQVQRILPTLVSRNLVSVLKKGHGRGNNHKFQINVDHLRSLKAKGDNAPSFTEEETDEAGVLKGDNAPPYIDSEKVTSAPTKGDIHDAEKVTSDPVKGDICSSLYRVIGKESVKTNPSVSAIGNARAQAKQVAHSLRKVVNEDLGELAVKIALRHPRSRLRQWTERNVGQTDQTAILDAMEAEAQEQGVSMSEAGRMMLELFDQWDDVPREQWQFAAAIPKFFKQGDYRLPPTELPGVTLEEAKRNGKHSGNGPRNSRRDTDRNDEALREFLASQGIEAGGDRPVVDGVGEGAGTQHDGDTADLHGGVVGIDTGRDYSGVRSGNGGVQVLPPASYPPRVQWPRCGR